MVDFPLQTVCLPDKHDDVEDVELFGTVNSNKKQQR